MDKLWKDTFLLHSETKEFSTQVEKAKQIVSDALSRYQKPYIAFSGGKDSTVTTHITLQQKKSILVFHQDKTTYVPRHIFKETVIIAKKLGALNFQTKAFDRKHRFEVFIPQMASEGYDAVFVGLRKQESIKRKLRIAAGRFLGEIPEVWPVQNFSWMDIWAYIVENELPFHSVYNIYAPIVGWDRARFHTFFDPKYNKFGCPNLDGVLMWKHRFDKAGESGYSKKRGRAFHKNKD